MKKIATMVAAASLAACSNFNPMTVQAPEAVTPPAGHRAFMRTTGMGDLAYECRAKAGEAGAFEWAFVGPTANLVDSNGRSVGRYYGGPTWEANDGSKVTGTQVAVAPASQGNIPYQLVRANPATGQGAMSGVTYIQRVNTKGGVAPAMSCGSANEGTKQAVKYEADYVFYRM